MWCGDGISLWNLMF
uniref:Uncharacterized protein n=1 Tax=Anguilla anguilla TaxID=7936 RepID=A0A0E9SFG2_ANGAN